MPRIANSGPSDLAWPRVETARLVAILLPPAALAALAAGDTAVAGAIAGCDLAAFPADERAIAARRHDDLVRDPGYLPWSLRALCLKPDLRLVGYFNFHSRPDAEYLRDLAPGAVEMGYHILPACRRRGLAEEAVRGMMDWARDAHGVHRFVLSISPANAPSLAMAAKLGFAWIGGHQDETDGYEDIFALTLAPAAGPVQDRTPGA